MEKQTAITHLKHKPFENLKLISDKIVISKTPINVKNTVSHNGLAMKAVDK